MLSGMLISPGPTLEIMNFSVDKKSLVWTDLDYVRTIVSNGSEQAEYVSRAVASRKPEAILLEQNLAFEKDLLFEKRAFEFATKPISISIFRMRYIPDMARGLDRTDTQGQMRAMINHWAKHILPVEGAHLLKETTFVPHSSPRAPLMATHKSGDHKRNFQNFIEPGYGKVDEVDATEIRAIFQDFHAKLLGRIPDDPAPKDPYMFNAHMGDFCRELDKAKDAYCKGLLGYYKMRGTCKEAKEAKTS